MNGWILVIFPRWFSWKGPSKNLCIYKNLKNLVKCSYHQREKCLKDPSNFTLHRFTLISQWSIFTNLYSIILIYANCKGFTVCAKIRLYFCSQSRGVFRCLPFWFFWSPVYAPAFLGCCWVVKTRLILKLLRRADARFSSK